MEKPKSTPSTAKMAFTKLRHRPASLPVSEFAFRFNPADEETLMELQQPMTDETKSASKNASKNNSRNLSLDEDKPDSPEMQTWSFLSDIKGKITRTMEEKFRIDLHGGSPVTSVQDSMKSIEKQDPEQTEEKADNKLTDTSSADEIELLGEAFEDATNDSGQIPTPEFSKDIKDLEIKGNDALEMEASSNLRLVKDSEPPLSLSFAWDPKYWKVALSVFVCLICAWLPLPAYFSGFFCGCLLVMGCVLLWLQFIGLSNRIVVVERPSYLLQSRDCRVPPNKSLVEGPKKVWMNELFGVYLQDEFHMNQTQSVLLRLDGSVLRLSYPKANVPKRAMWNEQAFDETFIHQRHYDLKGADIQLLPQKLPKRRLWIRKYPIFIRLAEDAKVVDIAAPAHLTKTKDGSLTFFARTGREKEECFRIFEAASKCSHVSRSEPVTSGEKERQEYLLHVTRLISATTNVGGESSESSRPVTWLNALLGCSLWDFMRGKEGAILVKEIMQKKLNMIKVPYFVEGLRITDLELGSELPQLLAISSPILNEKGLWIDFDMSYFGAFHMTLETKLNLLKFKKEAGLENYVEVLNSELFAQENNLSSKMSACDSEEDDSAESSSDDDYGDQPLEANVDDVPLLPSGTPSGRHSTSGAAASKKILRFVDTIAQSRYFQQATEYKYVKRAMEGVSNTRLILSVEVLSLTGVFTINIPPPPSDRLWYGFRGNPQLTVVAKPKVGEREVNLTNIVEWIESKLVLEFQRLLVMPNMDDLIIPFVKSGIGRMGSSPDSTPATPSSLSKEML